MGALARPARQSMIILSCDPGERNSAYAVVSYNGATTPTILETGFITDTLVNLTSEARIINKTRGEEDPALQDGYRAFKAAQLSLYRKYKINHFAAERFQTRGVKSRSTETVSMMNAIAIAVADSKGATYRLLVASQWKNWLNKIMGTKDMTELYAFAATKTLAPHTVDSIFIGLYEYCMFLEGTIKPTKAMIWNMVRAAWKVQA